MVVADFLQWLIHNLLHRVPVLWKFHRVHHDISTEGAPFKNFGIVFSLWDFIFHTAFWPRDRNPAQLGYPGMEEMLTHLGGQMLWPLTQLRTSSEPGTPD